MVWITADQSQINLDFSPVRKLTMWLLVLRESYIAIHSEVLVVLYNSEWVRSRKQSKHSHVWTIQKLKNCYDPFKILEAAYLLLLLFRRKKKKLNAFSWAKNTARGVRFLLGFNMYLILARCEQVYLFLVLAQKRNVKIWILVLGTWLVSATPD